MAPNSYSFNFPELPAPESLANLVASNAAPNSMQSRLTHAYIDELEGQLTLIDDAMKILSRRHAEIKNTLKAYKPIVSPIRRLPPEILGEIFSYSVSRAYYFGDISEVSGPMSHLAPWVFTHVCRYWAAVALATPTLWSLMFLDLDRMQEHASGAVMMTKLRLERARDLPLTVKIFHEHYWEYHPVLDVAIASSERWENAHIYITFPLLFQLLSIPSLPALTTLTISAEMDIDETEVAEAFWDTFAVAPQLKSVCATFWDFNHLRSSPFTFQWHQFTRLTTTFTSNTEALRVLQKLSNIVECRMEYQQRDILPQQSTIIHLPHLRSLTILMQEETRVSAEMQQKYILLNLLETPRLEQLTTQHTADIDSIVSLLTRSGCASSLSSLSSLHLHAASICPDALLRLVQKMPRLAALVIGDLSGIFIPRSPLPTFVSAFSSQWLEAHRSAGDRQRLYVRFVDCGLTGRLASEELAKMSRDGLVMEISANPGVLTVIGDDFD